MQVIAFQQTPELTRDLLNGITISEIHSRLHKRKYVSLPHFDLNQVDLIIYKNANSANYKPNIEKEVILGLTKISKEFIGGYERKNNEIGHEFFILTDHFAASGSFDFDKSEFTVYNNEKAEAVDINDVKVIFKITFGFLHKISGESNPELMPEISE